LVAARQACQGTQEDRALVVLDRRRLFYPPAAAALGFDVNRIMVVRPGDAREELWALDQALRCPAVGAVWGAIEALDDLAGRRLQLAAEAGGSLGLLIRPAAARREPSWAAVQLAVRGAACHTKGDRAWRVEVVRCRGGTVGGAVEIESGEIEFGERPLGDVAPDGVLPRRARSARA